MEKKEERIKKVNKINFSVLYFPQIDRQTENKIFFFFYLV